MGVFYLYRHIREDKNQVFYIGIGTKPKKYNTIKGEFSRAYNFYSRRNHWKNVYQKSNGKITVEIMLESDDQEDIKQKEIEFIKLYGRRDLKIGTLVNSTDGGDGVTSPVITDDIRHKHRVARLGRKMSDESKQKMRDRFISEDTRRKISEINKGKKMSSEARLKMSLAKKGKKQSPEHIQKVRQSLVGYKHSEETKRKISTSNKGKKLSVEHYNKLQEGKRNRVESIETRLKRSKMMMGKRLSHETIKKISETKKLKFYNKKFKNQLPLF